MKFIRGSEGQIINLQYVEIIDTVMIEESKFEVQAKLSDFSAVLASFEHFKHASEFIDQLWKEIRCQDVIQ